MTIHSYTPKYYYIVDDLSKLFKSLILAYGIMVEKLVLEGPVFTQSRFH